MTSMSPDATSDLALSRSEVPADQGGVTPGLLRFAWFTLGFTIFTIVGGALVRATHSGDGCGRSWPSCDGAFILRSTEESARLIEFTHRTVSGVSLLLVAALLLWVLRSIRAPHPARKAAIASMILIVIEALIGAAIVLYGWVADDTSVARQISVPLHLVNTFALTAALTLTVWLIAGGRTPRFHLDRALTRSVAGLAALIVLVAATGATTALADTVFMVDSPEAGAVADFEDERALILRIRILHPIVAITTAALLTWFVFRRADEAERRGHVWPGRIILGIVVVQVALGFMHIVLGSPLASALLHLFLAQALWIAFLFFALSLLQPPGEVRERA